MFYNDLVSKARVVRNEETVGSTTRQESCHA